MLSYKNVMCVYAREIMGVGGYAEMVWGGYMYICSGFNFVLSNAVWQGDQCLIFHILLPY